MSFFDAIGMRNNESRSSKSVFPNLIKTIDTEALTFRSLRRSSRICIFTNWSVRRSQAQFYDGAILTCWCLTGHHLHDGER